MFYSNPNWKAVRPKHTIIMNAVVRFPAAASGLGALLKSLPWVVRDVLFRCNLQRTGCLKCGVGPHHVFECPQLTPEEAADLERKAYKRWAILVGEEMMLYGASSSVEAYEESAKIRMAERKDLPNRPPRRMNVNQLSAARNDDGRPGSPLLPTPKPTPADIFQVQSAPTAVVADSSQRKEWPKPMAKSSQSASVAKPAAKPDPKTVTLLTKGKEKETVVSSTSSSSRCVAGPSAPRQQNSISAPMNGNEKEEADNAEEEWADDNVLLDNISKLAKQVTQVVGDIEMIKARLSGNRRGRPFTPSSSSRPTKVARESAPQQGGQVLNFQEDSTQEILAKLSTDADAKESQDMLEDSQSEQGSCSKYDEWSLSRYKKAKTVHARGLFWEKASKEAKERMTKELLGEEPMAAVTIQARQMKWILF